MAALPDLITVAQFRELPDNDAYRYELHHGEVVALTRPKYTHNTRQHRLRDLLQSKLPSFEVRIELSFRVVPEFDVRVADVAAITKERDRSAAEAEDVFGAPELVIEVKSPSNTKAELRERASLCLNNGALEFWIVDEKPRTITVLRRDGSSTVYCSGDSIPLAAFGSDSLSVDEIFA
jgi:Uma2 family endonuclease